MKPVNVRTTARNMSRNASSARPPRKTKNHGNQPQWMPVWALIATDMKKEPMTRTKEMPTANALPYSQPPRKPALGLMPRAMYV